VWVVDGLTYQLAAAACVPRAAAHMPRLLHEEK
jgi:hypothetical protein